MAVNETAGVASNYYTSGAILSNTTVASKAKEADQSSVSPSYTVNLSSEGLSRSRARFEAQQTSDERAFQRRLDQEEASKTRELEADKRQFDRQQASEKRKFEAEQRIEAIRFEQQR